MKAFMYVFYICFCCSLILACEQKKTIKPSGKKINIGIIIPNEDSVQSEGTQGLIGIKLAQKQHPYLQNGDKIKLIIENGQNNPQLTRKVLKKLLDKDNVAAVLMFSNSDSVMAASVLADQYQTPVLALTATHPDVTKNRSFVNQFVFDDKFQGQVTAMFVRDELLVNKVAVINLAYHMSSRYLGLAFIEKFQSVDGIVTDMVELKAEGNDYLQILQGIRRHSPELLYIPVYSDQLIAIAETLKKMHWSPRLMGSDGLISNVFLKHKDKIDLLDGLMATDFFGNNTALTPFGKEIRDKYKFQHGHVVISYAPLGTESFSYLISAMNLCKNPQDSVCINNKLRLIEDFSGVMGKISIQPDGRSKRPLIVNSIDDNKPKFLVKVY